MIHMAGELLQQHSPIIVREVLISDYLQAGKKRGRHWIMKVYNVMDDWWPPIKDVVERARSKIGEAGFNLMWNNCESFVYWARYNQRQSNQVRLHVAAFLTCFTVIALHHLVGVLMLACLLALMWWQKWTIDVRDNKICNIS